MHLISYTIGHSRTALWTTPIVMLIPYDPITSQLHHRGALYGISGIRRPTNAPPRDHTPMIVASLKSAALCNYLLFNSTISRTPDGVMLSHNVKLAKDGTVHIQPARRLAMMVSQSLCHVSIRRPLCSQRSKCHRPMHIACACNRLPEFPRCHRI